MLLFFLPAAFAVAAWVAEGSNATSHLDITLPHAKAPQACRKEIDALLLCARLTVRQDDGFHLIWTAFKYHR